MDALPFPRLRRIEDVLPAVEGRKEFIVARRDGFTVVDYAFQAADTFGSMLDPDPEARRLAMLRREARGLKFAEDGSLLARPWPKFFNLGEKEEAQPNRVDWSAPHWVIEKLDGSMVHPALLRGRLVLMTMMGVTPVAEQAMRHAFADGRPYAAMCRALMDEGWLPIYEWCSRQMRIVVDYPVDRVVLTGVRRQDDGRIMSYPETAELAARWGVPVARAWEGGRVADVAGFLAHARALRDMEGYVIRFASGLQLKVKADDYVLRHGARDGLTQEKNALALVLAGKEDDVLPHLAPADRDALARYAAAVRASLSATAARIEAEIATGLAAVGGDRKRFAREVAPSLGRLASIGFAVAFEGRPAIGGLVEFLLKATRSGARVDAVRDLLGGHRWQDFWSQPSDEGRGPEPLGGDGPTRRPSSRM